MPEQNPPGTRPVYFMFANTALLGDRDTLGNAAARLITQSDLSHVELLFYDAPALTYTITQNSKKIQRIVEKNYADYYVAYSCYIKSECVEKMQSYCADQLEAQKKYDDRGFYCCPFATIAYYLSCGSIDPFVNADALTCTRLVGGALRSAGLWNISEAKLDILTCNDILNRIKDLKAVEVPLPTIENTGVYN